MKTKLERPTRDLVDRSIKQWSVQRPDLDASALGVVSRILILAGRFERCADRALDKHDLSLWQLDVLGAIARSGPPYALHPKQLSRSVFLSSGAMTNRIDRLEQAGLVERQADPDDRRAVLVALTETGLKLAQQAIASRFTEAKVNIEVLSTRERKVLANLLRKLNIENAEREARMAAEAEAADDD